MREIVVIVLGTVVCLTVLAAAITGVAHLVRPRVRPPRAGGVFGVELATVGERPIEVVKILRDLGHSFEDGRRLMSTAETGGPIVVGDGMSEAEAATWVDRLLRRGAQAAVRV